MQYSQMGMAKMIKLRFVAIADGFSFPINFDPKAKQMAMEFKATLR